MKSILILLVAMTTLSACEKYTDATSPCFGKDGKPDVGRSAALPLAFADNTATDKECDFQLLGGGP